jgi:hypothetical protein
METAKQAVQSMYPNEELTDVEIEEVEQELMGDWIITVGFNRPKTRRTLGGLTIPVRTLKRVVIERDGGNAKSIKMYKNDG